MQYRIKYSIFDHSGTDTLAGWVQKLNIWLDTRCGLNRWRFIYRPDSSMHAVHYLSNDGYKFRLFDYIEFEDQDDMLAFILVWGGTDEWN